MQHVSLYLRSLTRVFSLDYASHIVPDDEIDNAQEVDEAEATRSIAKKRWDGNNAGQRSWKRGQIYESADDALEAGHLLKHSL